MTFAKLPVYVVKAHESSFSISIDNFVSDILDKLPMNTIDMWVKILPIDFVMEVKLDNTYYTIIRTIDNALLTNLNIKQIKEIFSDQWSTEDFIEFDMKIKDEKMSTDGNDYYYYSKILLNVAQIDKFYYSEEENCMIVNTFLYGLFFIDINEEEFIELFKKANPDKFKYYNISSYNKNIGFIDME